MAFWAVVTVLWPPAALPATTAPAIAAPSAHVWAEREIFIGRPVTSA